MRILLGVTGSVAAVLAPKAVRALRDAGHEVEVVATKSARHFFRAEDVGAKVWTDEDEWPEGGYRKGMPVLHVRLRDWADALVIAPLSANTLAKLANGLCDDLLTCVWRAWEAKKPVVLAPAMNTKMWEHPFTARHLRSLDELRGAGYDVRIVPPQAKLLACGDEGVGAMADVATIVQALNVSV